MKINGTLLDVKSAAEFLGGNERWLRRLLERGVVQEDRPKYLGECWPPTEELDDQRRVCEKWSSTDDFFAYSDPSRPLIPTQVGHPFRWNAATGSEVNPATFPSPLGIGGRHPSESWAG
jgi:hypothetical protein